MKKICVISMASVLPLLAQAQSQGKKTETLAIIGFFIVAFIGILIYFIIWKNSKKTAKNNDQEKFKIKTFEVVKNGRKVVMTKKYRITSDEEFPDTIKRKK
jgi:hypothetical protein